MTLKTICVFCGSRMGNQSQFQEQTQLLAAEFLRRDLSLVYGGGTVGLMGVIARGVHDGGGSVKGIIPKALTPREISNSPIGEVIEVPDMHTRKLLMHRNSDAFIALPGGFGTFEELMEAITWVQLGIHKKPIGLLNIAGFFDPLLEMINNGFKYGFIEERIAKESFVVSDDPKTLLDLLMNHQQPASVIKWLDESVL